MTKDDRMLFEVEGSLARESYLQAPENLHTNIESPLAPCTDVLV